MTDDKSRKAWGIATIAIVIAGATIAIVVYAGSRSPEQSASPDKINIEVRAKPSAEIHVNGKKIGKTPIHLQYPKSDQEVVVEATLLRHWVKRTGKKDETFKGTRTVKLDRDQVLDFTYDNTALVDTKETGSAEDWMTKPKPGSAAKTGSAAQP